MDPLMTENQASASGSADAAVEPAPAEEEILDEVDEVDAKILEMLARLEAGGDWTKSKTRKVVRLSDEECKKILAITPWPPVMPPHLSEDCFDTIADPVLREELRGMVAKAAADLKTVHEGWARIREQYATFGYADMIVDVDELGNEDIVVD